MPLAFVTGGTGFLGLNLIDHLLDNGWQVVALHRPQANLDRLKTKDIQLVKGTITEPDSLLDIFPDKADAVFHVAGNTNLWSRHNLRQTRDNVDGTRNMIAAALKKKAARFIQTSSVAAYGHHQIAIDEKAESNAIDSPINYFRTKYLAEMEVRKGIDMGVDAVMLNPTNIIGPYDDRNWSQLFILVDRQKLPGVPRATQTFCHVREVVKAHLAAYSRGKKGENYLLGGVETDYLTLAREIGKLLGKPTPQRTTPSWILKALGRVSQWGSYITAKEPDLTPEKAYLATTDIRCKSHKAERELNYSSTSLQEMLSDCYRWLLSEGLIGKI